MTCRSPAGRGRSGAGSGWSRRHARTRRAALAARLPARPEVRRADVGARRTSGRRPRAGESSARPVSPSPEEACIAAVVTACWTIVDVASPSRISPGCAACSIRFATLTASPVTKPWPDDESPATTSPVLMPIRISSRVAQRASSSAFSSESRERMAAAARTARSASSSCKAGTPNTAMTSSPMNFSTVPPWRLDDLGHLGEVARHDLADGLRVEAVPEHRRARPRRRRES